MAQLNQKPIATVAAEIWYEIYSKSTPTTDDRPNLSTSRQLISDAYAEVCNSWDWSWMLRSSTFPTVAGQTTSYAVSATAKDILLMMIPSNQQKLQYIELRDWILANPGQYTNQGNSIPTFYTDAPPEPATDNGPRVFLGPAPADQVYTIKYFYNVIITPFTWSGTEYPVIPAPWQDLIKYKALVMHYRFFGPGAADKMAMAQQAYDALWTKAWTYDQKSPDGVHFFRDAWGEAAYSSQADINRVLFVGGSNGG